MAPKAKFRQDWLLNQEFQPWLTRVEGDSRKAFCNACKRTLGAEITSIKRHKTSQHHIAACRDNNQQEAQQLDNPPPPFAPGGHYVAMATSLQIVPDSPLPTRGTRRLLQHSSVPTSLRRFLTRRFISSGTAKLN
ncbi:hypothetical protein Pcinc_017115 [Petrolisthes cinctipes]|uniref:Uncharacterized protein n=1 Tax=Petrolisthes cinctipes TaxID=88211 RepID=A0AAE1KL35_PETCI|nr:hypothetical protein Pcinc_017115 [Petrolisthes cinctipes]